MTKPGPSVTSGADTQPGSDSLFPSGFGGGANVRAGGVGTTEIADGSVAAADLNLASVAAAIAARGELTGTYVQAFPVAAPSGDTTGTADRTAIQAQIDAANTAGGGEVILRAGTYWVNAALIIKSNVILRGLGTGVTTIKLKAAGNDDVLRTTGFSGLTLTQASGGPTGWALRGLTIDGNKAAQTGGPSYCLRSYGCTYRVDDVEFANGYTGGVWSEWGNALTAGLEAMFTRFRIHDYNGNGLIWLGPHDSVFEQGQVWSGSTGTRGIFVPASGNAGGEQFSEVHVYGAEKYGWVLEKSSQSVACVSEGATVNNLVVGTAKVQWAGRVFGTNGTNPSEIGVSLGDAGRADSTSVSYSSASSTIADPAITADDFGLTVTGANIPAGASVGPVTPGVSFVLYVAGAPANPTGSGTAVNIGAHGGISLCNLDIISYQWGSGAVPFAFSASSSSGGNQVKALVTKGTATAITTGTPNVADTVLLQCSDSASSSLVQRGTPLTVIATNSNALLVKGAATTFSVDASTSPGKVNLINSASLKGWTGLFTTNTVQIDSSNGAVQPGTASGIGARIFSGTGTPTISGLVGDMYIRVDGGAGTWLYRCTGTTNWTAVI